MRKSAKRMSTTRTPNPPRWTALQAHGTLEEWARVKVQAAKAQGELLPPREGFRAEYAPAHVREPHPGVSHTPHQSDLLTFVVRGLLHVACSAFG